MDSTLTVFLEWFDLLALPDADPRERREALRSSESLWTRLQNSSRWPTDRLVATRFRSTYWCEWACVTEGVLARLVYWFLLALALDRVR